MRRIKKKVLVTGACRSGTKSFSYFLKDCGIDAPHERMGKDGTVSCMFFIDAPYYPKSAGKLTHDGDHTFSDYRFKTIIHLIRHPLWAIPSQASVYSKDHIKWLEERGLVDSDVKPRLLHAAKLWLLVNRRVERMTKVRVLTEDVPSSWGLLSERLKLDCEIPEHRHMHKSSGFRKTKPMTWKELDNLCGSKPPPGGGYAKTSLADHIKKAAGRYGYL